MNDPISADVRRFFIEFERTSNELDLHASAAQFADTFLTADPNRVAVVPKAVGIAVGVAGLGAIYLAAGHQHLTAATGLPGSQARTLLQAAAAGQLPAADGQRAAAARAAFLTGFNQILLIGAGVAAAGAVLALLLIRVENCHRAGPPETRIPTDHVGDHQQPVLAGRPMTNPYPTPPKPNSSPPRTRERS